MIPTFYSSAVHRAALFSPPYCRFANNSSLPSLAATTRLTWRHGSVLLGSFPIVVLPGYLLVLCRVDRGLSCYRGNWNDVTFAPSAPSLQTTSPYLLSSRRHFAAARADTIFGIVFAHIRWRFLCRAVVTPACAVRLLPRTSFANAVVTCLIHSIPASGSWIFAVDNTLTTAYLLPGLPVGSSYSVSLRTPRLPAYLPPRSLTPSCGLMTALNRRRTRDAITTPPGRRQDICLAYHRYRFDAFER